MVLVILSPDYGKYLHSYLITYTGTIEQLQQNLHEFYFCYLIKPNFDIVSCYIRNTLNFVLLGTHFFRYFVKVGPLAAYCYCQKQRQSKLSKTKRLDVTLIDD